HCVSSSVNYRYTITKEIGHVQVAIIRVKRNPDRKATHNYWRPDNLIRSSINYSDSVTRINFIATVSHIQIPIIRVKCDVCRTVTNMCGMMTKLILVTTVY